MYMLSRLAGIRTPPSSTLSLGLGFQDNFDPRYIVLSRSTVSCNLSSATFRVRRGRRETEAASHRSCLHVVDPHDASVYNVSLAQVEFLPQSPQNEIGLNRVRHMLLAMRELHACQLLSLLIGPMTLLIEQVFGPYSFVQDQICLEHSRR
jgi:hypothetical protein